MVASWKSTTSLAAYFSISCCYRRPSPFYQSTSRPPTGRRYCQTMCSRARTDRAISSGIQRFSALPRYRAVSKVLVAHQRDSVSSNIVLRDSEAVISNRSVREPRNKRFCFCPIRNSGSFQYTMKSIDVTFLCPKLQNNRLDTHKKKKKIAFCGFRTRADYCPLGLKSSALTTRPRMHYHLRTFDHSDSPLSFFFFLGGGAWGSADIDYNIRTQKDHPGLISR